MLIEFDNVKKVYHLGKTKVYALNGISLKISEKEFTVIAGPSGSGKTTLLNLMGLLDKPTEGKVFFEERDVNRLSDFESTNIRRHRVGFIFQTFKIEEIITLWDSSNGIIKFILFMIAIFGIVNTMLMNVWERKKEIGTLRALGYSRREIRTLFIIESFWTGVMGVLVGWVIAFAVGLYLQIHGIVIPMDAFQGMISIPFGNVIYGKMCVSHFINIFIWGVIITIIAGLIPAVKASRMNIVDSLKEY